MYGAGPFGIDRDILGLIYLGLLLLGIIWICLPFAIFGIKPKLDQIDRSLQAILAEMKRQDGEAAAAGACPPHDYQPSPHPEIVVCSRCGSAIKKT